MSSEETLQRIDSDSIRRSNRVKNIPQFLENSYHSINNYVKSKSKIRYSISLVLSYDSLSNKKFDFTMTMHIEPRNYKETCKHPRWTSAMQREIEALRANNI